MQLPVNRRLGFEVAPYLHIFTDFEMEIYWTYWFVNTFKVEISLILQYYRTKLHMSVKFHTKDMLYSQY